jgi:UDP-N-acetylglucosamine transferase subunit ALG13
MIFVTVGAQMPFDRLVGAVDEWAARCGRADVFAQIGNTLRRPRHIQWSPFLAPGAFRAHVQQSSLVIAHAGMGSILTALELGKPILVMPRRGALLETRNDHQVATAHHFVTEGRIHVAFDEAELQQKLDRLEQLQAGARIAPRASATLLQALREFVDAEHSTVKVQH